MDFHGLLVKDKQSSKEWTMETHETPISHDWSPAPSSHPWREPLIHLDSGCLAHALDVV